MSAIDNNDVYSFIGGIVCGRTSYLKFAPLVEGHAKQYLEVRDIGSYLGIVVCWTRVQPS